MTASRTWSAWSCTVRLTVDDPAVLDVASRDLRALMDRVDRAASRFRRTPNCPLSTGSRQPRAGLTAAGRPRRHRLVAGRESGGAIDPTVGGP